MLGSIICAALGIPALLLPRRKRLKPAEVKKVLVVKFFGIGSLVLASPFFLTARETFPEAEIHLLTLSSNKGIIPMLPAIDRVHFVELGGNTATAVLAYMMTLFRVNRGRFDVLIDMEFYTRASSVVTFASWAPVRIGYHSRGVYRGAIHNFRVPFNVYWHVTRNFIGLLSPFGVEVPENAPQPRLNIPEKADIEAAATLTRLGVAQRRFLVVNVNAGELAYERRWPVERFAQLTARLCEKYGLAALFIGSASEARYVERAVRPLRDAGCEAHNLAGEIGLECLIGLCRKSALTITNDSGPMHLAVAARAPIAAFFGPETPMLYGPLGDGHLVFYQNLACSPCISIEHGKELVCWHQTPFCQTAISVDKAFDGIEARFAARLTRLKG